jgi:hypothetical protein
MAAAQCHVTFLRNFISDGDRYQLQNLQLPSGRWRVDNSAMHISGTDGQKPRDQTPDVWKSLAVATTPDLRS